ncbi:hypothetical protein [Streptomyces sp. NBC_01431]|uniref:hypothetical protein n=1 Tax=Streptomyces sp. NBC_01431 TaxID=2903863 RepID=UPI002E304E4D|nr:hypothetical protein [Streptomyces sp. NBC_01431]
MRQWIDSSPSSAAPAQNTGQHLISLVLGGDPDDPRNIWVEPPSPAHKPGGGPNNPKDTVEAKLSNAVYSGKIQLAAAHNAIATNWTTALAKLGLTRGLSRTCRSWVMRLSRTPNPARGVPHTPDREQAPHACTVDQGAKYQQYKRSPSSARRPARADR